MRRDFADEITKIAAADSRVVLLSGDIGNTLFDAFKTRFPNRFYNCGVAEANMAGVAAGLAMCDLRPITYTITPFNTTRCLEQIRDDIAYHNLPVLIVGTGAGLSYASLGCTHHSCEDLSFLRSIPNMTVLAPGDAWELRKLLHEVLKMEGPVYMRIGKTGEPLVHSKMPDLAIGKGLVVLPGNDLCILSTGNLLPMAVEAAALLAKEKIETEVISMHTIKPLDVGLLSSLQNRFSLIATLEEHSAIGGLGSAVAEWLAEQPGPIRLKRFNTPDRFPHAIGSQQYMRDQFGLNPIHLSKSLIQELNYVHSSCDSGRNR